ncbi:MAG TPA: hypothetical protein P5279_04605 [Anaerohalosphaeraceae bacterium]|jgi:hypothetical protein|nr:hypothetical protein [Anaerohalosphaeraceae bacterium]HRT49751.1 hypothetical protein [Anaerohalosphaeraceae bacterium]HRT85589.1 hypothetical protein [Anaerohalosphaeraceae bacterium]
MAHPDLDGLLNTLYPAAQQFLKKHGEFYPFGATVDKEGKTALVSPLTSDEHPASQEVIDQLTRAFCDAARKGLIRASGLCYDARVIPPGQTEKCDAICAQVEHENGESFVACLPYRKTLFGIIKYGEVFASRQDRTVFVSHGG